MTLFEVFVVIAIILLLAALLLPMLDQSRRKVSHLGCVNCLKQMGLAYRIWAGDHGDLYPMMVPVASGGARELAVTGNVAAVFQVMSNELSTPRVLICPDDTRHDAATNFSTLASTNLSYFVGLDVDTNDSPQLILSGDANLTLHGMAVKSGLLNLTSNSPVGWTTDRHGKSGNLVFNDGRIEQVLTHGLQRVLQETSLATNHLAIP